MIKLYENIRNLRKNNQWTQEELARKMGYTDRSMIAKIESGKVDLPQSKILEFANIFNVDPGDLMGWAAVTETPMSEKAKAFMDLYLNSSPDAQKVAETVLKSLQQNP